MKKKILIICSDPDSINYEIIKKSIFFFKKKRKNKYIFVGCRKLLKKNFVDLNALDIINVTYISKINIKEYISESFRIAIDLIKKKKAHGLINLPINKKNFFSNSEYPGITEYLSKKFNCKQNETMLLFNNEFSVSPLTTHVRLSQITNNIDKKKIFNNCNNIINFYKKIIGIKKPKIGILGFNPHNGQDFSKEIEETKILIPTIKKIKNKKNVEIFGPISPDSSFLLRKKMKLDSLIGIYHDQVLTTFKYIFEFNAINITLGLPFIRVSPDHGTAKNLMGKNKADISSFINCLNFFEKYHKKI